MPYTNNQMATLPDNKEADRQNRLRALCDQTDEGRTFAAVNWARGGELHANRDVIDLVIVVASG